MEQRKLIRLGNSSFAIALPKEWVEKAGLKKGDDIFIERNNNGELMVSSKFKAEDEKKIEINLEGKDEEFIKKKLHAAYTKGYNLITLKGDEKLNKIVKGLLNDYLSFEIIDSNNNEITIKDFFDIKEAKFENFVRRIDMNLREMFELIISQSKNKIIKKSSLKEIEEIDRAVNKFYFLCSRIFFKGVDNPTVLNVLKLDGSQLFNNWWIAFHLESLGDGLKYALKQLCKINPEKKDDIYNTLLKLQQNHIESIESFYKNDSEKAMKVIEETKKIKEEIEKLEKDNSRILKITEALEQIRRSIYQNAKMVLYMRN